MNTNTKKILMSLSILMISACATNAPLQEWKNYTIKPNAWTDENVDFGMNINDKQAKSDASSLLEQLNALDFSAQTINFLESRNMKSQDTNETLYEDGYGIYFDYDTGESISNTTYKKKNVDEDTGETYKNVYRLRQTNFYTESKDTEYTLIESECLNDFVDNSYSAIIKVDDSTSKKINDWIADKRAKICDIYWVTDFLNSVVSASLYDNETIVTYSHTYSRNYKKGDEYAVIFTANISQNSNDKSEFVEEIYSFCPAFNLYQMTKTIKKTISSDAGNNIEVLDIYSKQFWFYKQNNDTYMGKDKEDLLKHYSTADKVDIDLLSYPYLANYGEETYAQKIASYFNLV